MKKHLLFKKAVLLRKKGDGLMAIARKLSISKSTASIWCQSIPLTEKQKRNLFERSNERAIFSLLKAANEKHNNRIKETIYAESVGKREVGRLTKRDIFMVGLGLYWGEGYKKGNQELGFTNSDPLIIQFYILWLNRIYGIEKNSLILRVSINEQHTKRINEVTKYWSKITNVPSCQFTKPSLIRTKSKKVYKNHSIHFGTLRIKVRRGTQLRRKILGSISALSIK